MQALIISTLFCLAKGPALTRESTPNFERLQDIEITENEIVFSSVNQIGVPSEFKFKIKELNLKDCPATVIAEDEKKNLMALRGLYQTPAGTTDGRIIFENKKGECFMAPVECPLIQVPECKSGQDEIDLWEIY